jgi:hypothetical protein
MPEAKIGDQVQVDISGIETQGVSIGGGILAPGVIEEVIPSSGEIKVHLGVSFGGKEVVIVPAKRVELLPAEASATVAQTAVVTQPVVAHAR